jgi:hypothetical protein
VRPAFQRFVAKHPPEPTRYASADRAILAENLIEVLLRHAQRFGDLGLRLSARWKKSHREGASLDELGISQDRVSQ